VPSFGSIMKGTNIAKHFNVEDITN
jgi:hypothetical protein